MDFGQHICWRKLIVIGRCGICFKNVGGGVMVPLGHIPTPKGSMRELVVGFVDKTSRRKEVYASHRG